MGRRCSLEWANNGAHMAVLGDVLRRASLNGISRLGGGRQSDDGQGMEGMRDGESVWEMQQKCFRGIRPRARKGLSKGCRSVMVAQGGNCVEGGGGRIAMLGGEETGGVRGGRGGKGNRMNRR